MKALRAYNTLTGLWFVKGKGFVEECMHRATLITETEMAVVRFSYCNAGVDTYTMTAECGCDACDTS